MRNIITIWRLFIYAEVSTRLLIFGVRFVYKIKKYIIESSFLVIVLPGAHVQIYFCIVMIPKLLTQKSLIS